MKIEQSVRTLEQVADEIEKFYWEGESDTLTVADLTMICRWFRVVRGIAKALKEGD
jgi:hypothetical protein